MLRLYKPAFEELGYRRSLLSDPATMSYNEKWGGTVDFPKEKWEAWYGQWLLADKRERWYRYLYSENEGCFVKYSGGVHNLYFLFTFKCAIL